MVSGSLWRATSSKNHCVTALREIIEKKMKGQKIIAPHEEAAPRGKVVDLMAALRKSIGETPL